MRSLYGYPGYPPPRKPGRTRRIVLAIALLVLIGLWLADR
ncbi:hypothetical protein M2302_001046 [Micromonospora sp. A200]|nr:hypothetical protein [Micromonospora sp. A200]